MNATMVSMSVSGSVSVSVSVLGYMIIACIVSFEIVY